VSLKTTKPIDGQKTGTSGLRKKVRDTGCPRIQTIMRLLGPTFKRAFHSSASLVLPPLKGSALSLLRCSLLAQVKEFMGPNYLANWIQVSS